MATALQFPPPANTSGVDPLDLRVVIRPDPPEQVTKGGIILPDTEVEKGKYAATKGTLIALGVSAFAEASRQPGFRRPEPGARIMFGKYAGTTFKGADGYDYIIANDEDVIGVLSE